MYGIGQQESGGMSESDRYHVVNSIGAVGKYQVMKSNVPGWSKQVLGHSITWQQFRDSPQLQEQIVRGILKGYWDKWGAKGAAAAWYAGPGNHNLYNSTAPQYGGPSIQTYVNSVLNHAGGYSGGGSTYSTGSGSITATTPHLSDKELAAQYGFTSAFLNSNSELKKLFKRAVKEGWNSQQFQAHLADTQWWKTHSQSEKAYLTLRYTDPATAKQNLSQANVKAMQLGNQLGIVVTDFTRKKMAQAAYNMVAKGWDENQVRYYLGQYVYFSGDKHQGEGGQVWDELHQYAYSMGVNMSDKWYAENARNVVRGIATEQDYKNQIQNRAKAAFPQYTKQIEGGQSVADIAQPYFQSMSSILELPGGSINLFDPTIKKALQYKDPSSGKTSAKPLWQFENDLRGDPRWKKTKNAQDSLMQVAHQVLTDFGMTY